MKEFLQRFVTLVVALLSGTLVALFVSVFGLVVPEFIIFPLSFGIGALVAAISAFVVGNRLAPSRTHSLLLIVVISEAAATIVAIAIRVLMQTSSPGSLPGPFFVVLVGMVFIALCASGATWYFNARTGDGLVKTAVMQVGLVGLAVLLGIGILYGLSRVTQEPCDPEKQAVLEEFPQYEEDVWRSISLRRPAPGIGPSSEAKSKRGSSVAASACGVRYRTQASEESVNEYYSEQLRAHGWTLVEPPPPEETGEPVLLLANRGSFSYEVVAFEAYERGEPTTPVQATVWKPSEMP